MKDGCHDNQTSKRRLARADPGHGRTAVFGERNLGHVAQSPDARGGHWGVVWSLFQLGRINEAQAEAEKLSNVGDRLRALSIIYHRQGDQDRSDAMLQEYIEKFPESYFNLLKAIS